MAKATKKKIETIPAHRIDVVKEKGSRVKNGFNYQEVIHGKKKKNTIHKGVGYDTYTQALRAAKRATNRLLDQLPVYYNGILKFTPADAADRLGKYLDKLKAKK
jgi:hypothetical protein